MPFLVSRRLKNYKKYPDLDEQEKNEIDDQIHAGFKELNDYLGSQLQRIAAKHDIAFHPKSMDEFMS